MDQRTFKIRDTEGTIHELKGDPNVLTLDDVVAQTGKQGGEKWDQNGVRFRIAGKEFGERDLKRSFSDLGVKDADVIEVLGLTSA